MLLGFACDKNTSKQQVKEQSNYKESMMKINKGLVKTEEQKIDDFISRYKWKMNTSGTGLRYMIYQKGNGNQAETGKIAELNFTVSLLNGEVCYSSADSKAKEFLIGRGGVESGLEEGILLLKEGDRAKFIIPSHLAFGLLGDLNKIPAKSVLVYDIELLKIK